LHVRFTFPAGTDVRGETFDLVDSTLSCGAGNTVRNLDASGVAPGDVLSFPIDRTTYNGPCTVTVQLLQDAQTATTPPLFGAGRSAAVTSGELQLGPPSLTASASDFSARWGGTNQQPIVVVGYSGSVDLAGQARNMALIVSNGDRSCGSKIDNPPPTTIDVDRSCLKPDAPFTVTIDYDYALTAHAHFQLPVTGVEPGPGDLSRLTFAATWNTPPSRPQVDVTYTGPSDELAVLGTLAWSEVVTSSAAPGITCGSSTANPAGSPARVDVDLAACPPGGPHGARARYTVTVSFTDPDDGETGSYAVAVAGTPPM
jgi:hypothetical protein